MNKMGDKWFQAFHEDDMDHTGMAQVQWSDTQHPKFKPSEEFLKPLEPWKPRSD